MSGIEADMTVLRAFQIPSTRGNIGEGKDKTKVVSVHASKASAGKLQSQSH
jgi:hypothetical protein